MQKKIKINLKQETEKSKKVINVSYYNWLIKRARNIFSVIRNRIYDFDLDDEDYVENFKQLDNIYNELESIIDELTGVIDEVNNPLYASIRNIESYNRIIQNRFMDLKVKVLFKMANVLQKAFDEEIAKQVENTQEVTNNTVFSIAAVFLGITLVSAMIAGIQYISKEYIFLYFLTIGWIATTILGLASVLIKRFDKKSFVVAVIVVLYTIVVVLYGWHVCDKKDSIVNSTSCKNTDNCSEEKCERLENNNFIITNGADNMEDAS